MKRLMARIDRRFNLAAAHPGFLGRQVPARLNYLQCFGGIAFVLYLLLVATGMLLSVYYVPAEGEAFRSVVAISRDVRLGFLVRGMHRWAGHLLIGLVLLHTVRVILQRAYLPPRELNWLAGVGILFLVLGSGFTGALLPWDQKGYWTMVVASGITETIPWAGEGLSRLLRGGEEVGAATLLRFYSLHVIWLPTAINLLLWGHFHMVKRLGIKGGL